MGKGFSGHYQAAADTDVIIRAKSGFLKGIIIGADVSNSIIEISDDPADGDGNVKVYLAGDTLMTSNNGYVPIGFRFASGICADITLQTHVTFVYSGG